MTIISLKRQSANLLLLLLTGYYSASAFIVPSRQQRSVDIIFPSLNHIQKSYTRSIPLYASKKTKQQKQQSSSPSSSSQEIGTSSTSSSSFSSKKSSSQPSRVSKLSTLLNWANEVQISKSTNLDAQFNSETGFGWHLVNTATNNDQVLLQVPTSVTLSVTSNSVPDDRDLRRALADDNLWKDLPWYAQMSIYLNHLKKSNSNNNNADKKTISRQPWLDSLPTSMNTPLHWTTEQRQTLDYKPLLTAISKQEQEWKSLYDKISAKLTDNISFEAFVWGCEMARSRAFSGSNTAAFNPSIYIFTLFLVTVYVGLNLGTIEQAANGAGVVLSVSILKDFVWPKLSNRNNKQNNNKYVICPLIDLTNHDSRRANAKVSFEYFANAYSLASTTNIQVGEQVLMSYGPRSNDQLLQYYGFVEANNPNDVYILPPLLEWDLDAIEQATGRKIAPGRLEQLQQAGLLGESISSNFDDDQVQKTSLTGVVVTRAVGLDPALWPVLRALMATEDEWQRAGKLANNLALENSGGPENEAAARKAAFVVMQQELERKDTSLDEDQTLLQRMNTSKGVDASLEDRLALQFRIEKKKVLSEVIDKLK